MKLSFLHIVLAILVIFSVFFITSRREPNYEDLLVSSNASCSKNVSRAQYLVCFREKLEKYVGVYGVKPFMKALADVSQEDPKKLGHYYLCHDIAHAIGELGGKYSQNVQKDISECTHICSAGCYHGFIESFVAKSGDIKGFIAGVCDPPQELSNSNKYLSACYHGIGHGVASIFSDLGKSIEICGLIESDYGKRRCFAGSMMEIFGEGSLLDTQKRYPDNILEFCATFPSIYRDHCLLLSGEKELLVSGNIEKAIKTCNQISKEMREDCFYILGEAMYFAFKDSNEILSQGCLGAGDYKKACLSGIFKGVAESDIAGRQGKKICGLVKDSSLAYDCNSLLQKEVQKEAVFD